MKKLGLLVMPLMAISLLASCGGGDKPEPTKYALTLTLNDCNVDGKSTYSKEYIEGSTIDNIAVSPNDGFALNDNSIKDTYKQYWNASTGDYYVLSGLVMNSNFDITITASSSYTITYKNVTSEEASSFTKTYTSNDLPLTLSTPTRTDWTFNGYYTNETFTDASKLTDNIIPVGTTGNLTLYAKMVYKTTTLEDCSWPEIKAISELGGARATFGEPDGTQTKKVQLTHQDLDNDGVIDANEVYQTVRIIGFNEDYTELPNPGETPDPNKAIGITFEFVDLISDENGYSLATYWNDVATAYGSNHNYKESTIRKTLNDGGGIDWFRFYGLPEGNEDPRNLKFATEPNYKKSVLNMLPDELTKDGILKTTSKYININNGGWNEQTVKDKLFLLSPAEMGRTGHTNEEAHTTTYSYYKGAGDSKRIKKQIKGSEEARTNYVSGTGTDFDGAYTGTKYSYSGYNSSTAGCGANLWLRSPNTQASNTAWNLVSNGMTRSGETVLSNAYAVAPAFCI